MGRLTYIELFAGCGGLSLGLSSLGFERVLANELSPMAAESYAYNLLGTDISSARFASSPIDKRKVLWIESSFGTERIGARLSENLTDDAERPYSDLDGAGDLRGKLLVGDIRRLNAYVHQKGGPLLPESPDVVSGGPPCQSFSLAGLREFGNHRNRLPWEFAKFVGVHKPKLAILENVSGILHPFKEGDKQVYAWFEVAKAFAKVGYAPICLHVNAVNVGVAQNRPRYLMFAVRKDLVPAAKRRLGVAAHVLEMGEALVNTKVDVAYDAMQHRVLDLRSPGAELDLGRLAGIFCSVGRPVSVREAIEDLSAVGAEKSDYVKSLDDSFGASMKSADPNSHGPFNHAFRQHSNIVKARFRIYQILAREDTPRDVLREVTASLRVPRGATARDLELGTARSLWKLAETAGMFLLNAQGGVLETDREVVDLVKSLRTKKHSQRALRANRPAPAALSIPDDACHYAEPRTLSVREMARIQSFPDNFVLRSIPTTGGVRRKFQVPQYTQVGNAVPPKLGRAIGEFANLLLGIDA